MSSTGQENKTAIYRKRRAELEMGGGPEKIAKQQRQTMPPVPAAKQKALHPLTRTDF